ncbi:MAG: PorT family protein [Muribaculaceae bacterium]|nr:PorT family protein [Muribaculaceae bacterium]
MSRLRILLVAFVALVSLSAAAETHYKPHVFVGARGGLSMGQMSFSPSTKQLWNMGSTGAVTFRYSEEKIFGLIAELGWVQRGWKENFEQVPLNYRRTLTYINLPLLTHIYFGSRRYKGFVNLGPQVSYMIGDKIESDFDYEHPGNVKDFPRNRRYEQLSMDVKNKFDYGICAGVGMEFYVHPRHSVTLEGRFYYGLGNIFPAAKADVFGASRPMSIEVTLGYNFRIK